MTTSATTTATFDDVNFDVLRTYLEPPWVLFKKRGSFARFQNTETLRVDPWIRVRDAQPEPVKYIEPVVLERCTNYDCEHLGLRVGDHECVPYVQPQDTMKVSTLKGRSLKGRGRELSGYAVGTNKVRQEDLETVVAAKMGIMSEEAMDLWSLDEAARRVTTISLGRVLKEELMKVLDGYKIPYKSNLTKGQMRHLIEDHLNKN